MWRPQPIDTSGIELPESVLGERETLSRQAHDIWAAKRLKDGWRYGKTRDDDKQTHPNLVPYDELADRDKAYDRELIDGTLRLLIKLGFRIDRPPPITHGVGIDTVGVESTAVDAAGIDGAAFGSAGVDGADADSADLDSAGVEGGAVDPVGVDRTGVESASGAGSDGAGADVLRHG